MRMWHSLASLSFPRDVPAESPCSCANPAGIQESFRIFNPQAGQWEGNFTPVFRKPVLLCFILFFSCSHSEKYTGKLERRQERGAGENALPRDTLNLFSSSKIRLRDDLSSVLSASTAGKHYFVRGSLIYLWSYNKNQCLDAEVKWLRHVFISTRVNKHWQVNGNSDVFPLVSISRQEAFLKNTLILWCFPVRDGREGPCALYEPKQSFSFLFFCHPGFQVS